MFVHQRTRIVGELQYFARIAHGKSEGGSLGGLEAAEINCHEKSSHLIIRNLPGSVGGNDFLDLALIQSMAVALGLDDGKEIHALLRATCLAAAITNQPTNFFAA